MASIGRITLSIASGVMETTAALANFNFDFSIVRMEPPAEYRAIGSNLSKRRKQEAEEGKIHATARKLGALFADAVPHVPNLERLYGLRASEIVENRTINPEASSSYGAIQGYVGLDATSIWAAATSGRGAIQVHLLACILARQWSPSQAISIWSELVSARKSQLESLLQEDQFHLGQLMAAQIDVDPSKLAQWDASARSWLHAADKMFLLQQKQLMLIIDNIDRNLSSKDAVYQTVLRIWCNTLSFMEKIASGMALSVDNPDIFIGLSAWHLYPDMTILGNELKHVSQKDKLIPEGAMVTVGMQKSQNPNYSTGSGITWTIPLARLKYYGRPKISTSTVGTSSSRAPFERLIQIALGSLISDWGPDAVNLSNILNFFTALAERCRLESNMIGHSTLNNDSITHASWSALFADQAKKYHQLRQAEKLEFNRYVNLGRRRYRGFVAEEKAPPFFGLGDAFMIMSYLHTEAQIAYLREYAAKHDLGVDLRNAVILYGDGTSSGIASVLPQDFGLSGQPTLRSHRHWILLHSVSRDEMKLRGYDPEGIEDMIGLEGHTNNPAWYTLVAAGERSAHIMDNTPEPCGFIQRGMLVDPNSSRTVERFSGRTDVDTDPPSIFHWMPSKETIDLERLEDLLKKHTTTNVSQRHRSGWTMASARSQYEGMKFRLVGNTRSIALYVPVQSWKGTVKLQSSVDFIVHHIPNLPMDDIVVTQILNTLLTKSILQSLAMLSRAAEVYSMMSTASVDLTVASEPLHIARWLSEIREPVRTIEEAFACICRFDSGIDLKPSDFNGVMGISSNDVMYVCDALLDFPVRRRTGVRCVPGNIGKPGVCLLICPPDLDFYDTRDEWNLINHAPFDGTSEDSFDKTSLHLKLTGSEVPLDVGRRGVTFTDAMYVDAVVQVYDRDQWFTDIDVMTLYMPTREFIVDICLPSSTCEHSEPEKTGFTRMGTITAINNWPEIIDPPPNISVVKAHGNWSARLALACFMRARDYPLIVANESLCWACVKMDVERVGNNVFVLCSNCKAYSEFEEIFAPFPLCKPHRTMTLDPHNSRY